MSDAHSLDDKATIAEPWNSFKHPTIIAQGNSEQSDRFIASSVASIDAGNSWQPHFDARLSLNDTAERPGRG